MDIIECRNITRKTTDGRGGGRLVLDDVSLNVREGEVFTIIGPSGGGKTSLLRILNRLDEPSSGEVFFKGKPFGDYVAHELRRLVAMAFQSPKLFGPTVIDDLKYPLLIDQKRYVKDDNEKRGIELLESVGLDGSYIDRETDRFSGGETMRVAIARALMRQPEVLLLDEPTSGLDPEAARGLLDAIVRLNSDSGLTIVAVTHRFAYARLIGHRTMLLDSGRVVEVGKTNDFFENPKTEGARLFLRTDGVAPHA